MQQGKALDVSRIGKIEAAPELANEAAYARRILRERAGINVLRGSATVQLLLDATVQNAEGYELTASKKGHRHQGKHPCWCILWIDHSRTTPHGTAPDA